MEGTAPESGEVNSLTYERERERETERKRMLEEDGENYIMEYSVIEQDSKN
jgi:hypothetical protein